MTGEQPGAYPRPGPGTGGGPSWWLSETTQPVLGPCQCGGWQSCACEVPVAELRLFLAQLADLHAPVPHQRHALDVARCRSGEPLVTCPTYRRLSRINGLRFDRTTT